MATLNIFRHRFYKNDGTLNVGGKVYTYVPGTSTLRNTYTDSTAGTPNTNPIILDSKGEASIWQTGKIKVNVLQSDDTQVTGFPVDDIGYLIIADDIHAATNKTTPVDADEVGIWDSISEVLNRVTFANLWVWIQSKLAAPGAIGGTTPAAGTFTTLTATTLNSTGGALNGTLGATTPNTVAATTITGTTMTASSIVRGNTATGTTTSAAVVGVASSSGTGLYSSSDSGIGANSASTSGTGVQGASASSIGVRAASTSGTGMYATSTSGIAATLENTGGERAALRIVPQAEPTGANLVGDIYVTTAGVLKICTVAGTPGTWVSVGSQ